jgi:alkylation response protein AidB-like acyl-CoA dehydrogenase
MSVIGNTALAFSEEQAMILDVAREFCRDKSPTAAVRAQLDSDEGYDQAVWSEMVALGWSGIVVPEASGGSGLGVATLVPVVECMGRSMLGTPLISCALAAQLLLRAAGAERADSLLAEIATGSIATLALLETPDWGDPAVRCTVTADGLLQGSKQFVADAGVAQWFLVPAMQAGAAALAVVSRDALAAAAITPHVTIDETRRSARVDFTGVTASAVYSGPQVTQALQDVQLLGALLIAAEAAGSAGACLDTTVEYLKTRKQFGKLIGSYQALKHPAVEILNRVNSSRSLVYHAASLVDDSALGADAQIACRMAKAQASDTLRYAADRAVQFHGGMGFTYECDAQLYIRRAQWSQQQFGDAQHHRKRLAALLLD